MKKIFPIFLVLVMILSGCAVTDDSYTDYGPYPAEMSAVDIEEIPRRESEGELRPVRNTLNIIEDYRAGTIDPDEIDSDYILIAVATAVYFDYLDPYQAAYDVVSYIEQGMVECNDGLDYLVYLASADLIEADDALELVKDLTRKGYVLYDDIGYFSIIMSFMDIDMDNGCWKHYTDTADSAHVVWYTNYCLNEFFDILDEPYVLSDSFHIGYTSDEAGEKELVNAVVLVTDDCMMLEMFDDDMHVIRAYKGQKVTLSLKGSDTGTALENLECSTDEDGKCITLSSSDDLISMLTSNDMVSVEARYYDDGDERARRTYYLDVDLVNFSNPYYDTIVK